MGLGRSGGSSRLLRDASRIGPVTWACSIAVPLTLGCGQPNPKILDASEQARGGVAPSIDDVHAEPAKIRQLIALVRASEHTFVVNGLARSGPTAAQRLQVALDRDVDGVRSALEFIERIAAPAREDGGPADRVIMGPDQEISLRQWFLARLAEIEGRPIAAPPRPEATQAAVQDGGRAVTGNLQILDALLIVERSGLKFVAPPRKQIAAPVLSKQRPGRLQIEKRKPRAKEYTAREFADMLRKKWEFLGADIDDLDTFLDEIATDSFATMEPYVVVREDGSEELFRPWLEGQLAEKANAVAAGGAP